MEEIHSMATTPKTQSFATRIDIPADRREALVAQLNQSLADISDLSSQVHVAHWNVKGQEFFQLHELFDVMYQELNASTDEIAERITTLGGYAHGTVRDAADNSTLPPYPETITDGLEHVAALAERYAHFASHLRETIDKAEQLGDPTTADLYTAISREVDKRLWFLEAHLQGKGG